MELVLVGIVACAVGLQLFTRYHEPRARALRRAEALPSSSIEDLRVGMIAKVSGRIVCHDAPLEAPLSARTCVLYRSRVYRVETDEADLTLIAHDERERDFCLESGPRDILVRVRGAIFDVGLTRFLALDERVVPFVKAHDPATGRTEPTRLRARETGIPDGIDVIVCGVVAEEIDASSGAFGGYREPPRRLVLTSDRKHLLTISAAGG